MESNVASIEEASITVSHKDDTSVFVTMHNGHEYEPWAVVHVIILVVSAIILLTSYVDGVRNRMSPKRCALNIYIMRATLIYSSLFNIFVLLNRIAVILQYWILADTETVGRILIAFGLGTALQVTSWFLPLVVLALIAISHLEQKVSVMPVRS